MTLIELCIQLLLIILHYIKNAAIIIK